MEAERIVVCLNQTDIAEACERLYLSVPVSPSLTIFFPLTVNGEEQRDVSATHCLSCGAVLRESTEPA